MNPMHKHATSGTAPDVELTTFLEKLGAMRAAPEKFETAVREFAEWVHLDADALLQGQTFQLGSLDFTLVHYGAMDPEGATVVVDFGEFAPEDEARFLRGLLEHNLRTPAAVHGYYALSPNLNHMLFCMRVDLQKAGSGAQAIALVVGTAFQTMRGMREAVTQQLDAMHGKSVAADGQNV